MTTRKKQSAFFRGSEGAERIEEEQQIQKQKKEQRQAQANKPFRFYVPVGETRQVIICDDAPDFYMYEHALKDAQGNWGRLFTGCVKTFDNCPVCESQGKESYYAMMLTIVDLTPFKTRDGDKVEFSRKLLVVKLAQQKKFLRMYQKHGTLRGALIGLTRDGDKDASIGNDIEFIEFVDEAEMESYQRSWKDGEGKRHEELCSEPLDYEELFEEPDIEALRELVGGAPPPGSRASNERELSRPTARRGKEEEEAPRRGREPAGSRPRRGKDADDWEEAEDSSTFEEEAPRSRRGRAAEPEPEEAPRSRRGRAAEPEPEEAPSRRRGRAAEPEEEEAPRRSTRASRDDPPFDGGTPRRGRAAPEPEPEPEEAPRRGRRR